MAANTSPIFELTPVHKGYSLVPADTTTKKDVLTGGTNGTRIDQIAVSTTDTSQETLSFWIYDGSSLTWHLGDVVVAIGAGYTTVARVDAIGTLAPTLGYILVPYNYKLQVSALAAVTAGKQTDILCMGGDY